LDRLTPAKERIQYMEEIYFEEFDD